MSTTDYGLIIGLLLAFGVACWLAVMLSEARGRLALVEAERDGLALDLKDERLEHRLTDADRNAYMIDLNRAEIELDKAEEARGRIAKERDNARLCLAAVYIDADPTKSARDIAAIVRRGWWAA